MSESNHVYQRSPKRKVVITLCLLLMVVAAVVWQFISEVAPPPVVQRRLEPGNVELSETPLPWIPPGSVIEQNAPAGWSHIIYVAQPRIAAGDVETVSETVQYYAKLLTVNCLASVIAPTEIKDDYQLDQVAIGFGTRIHGRNTIINTATQEELGADLSLIGRQLLAQCERDFYSSCVQILRTSTMIVFDSDIVLWTNSGPRRMIARYAVLIHPKTGHLNTLTWVFSAEYNLVDQPMQRLEPDYREDRALYVNTNRFLFEIPLDGALSQVHTATGQPIPLTNPLKRVAGSRHYTKLLAIDLERELRSVLHVDEAHR